MISRKPILVTGSHRSGSTWVGRMIAQSPSVHYIHEPFNLNNGQCRCGVKFDYWFKYISTANESNYYEHLKHTIEYPYNLDIKAIRTPKDAVRMLKNYSNTLLYRIFNTRPLVKDPIAVFSAEWLASTFDMEVIVLIRHPAAFASSLKIKNWTHSFSHFLEQPLLMEEHLYPFEAEIREYANKEHDIIDQATLLWKLIHHMIIKYKKDHDDWIFILHEDISRDTLPVFQSLFKKLNLEFSESIEEVIKEYSNPENPNEPPKHSDSIKRDSKSNIWNWKRRLTTKEIERIREQVEDISQVFYSDKDW